LITVKPSVECKNERSVKMVKRKNRYQIEKRENRFGVRVDEWRNYKKVGNLYVTDLSITH
jgi:hypothetical protein